MNQAPKPLAPTFAEDSLLGLSNTMVRHYFTPVETPGFSDSVLSFRKQAAIRALRVGEQLAAGTSLRTQRMARKGARLRRSLGFGIAEVTGNGAGDAIAETERDSFGCATAIAEGPAQSRAYVGEKAYGSASAWSGYTGQAEARTEKDAMGDAAATAKGSGNAFALVHSHAQGHADARSRASGHASAIVVNSGNLSIETLGKGSLHVQHLSEGNLAWTHESPQSLRGVNRYPGQLRIHTDPGGGLTLERNGETELRSIPEQASFIVIGPDGSISFEPAEDPALNHTES